MHGWNATDVDHDGLGVRCMNELITKEMLEGGYVPDEADTSGQLLIVL